MAECVEWVDQLEGRVLSIVQPEESPVAAQEVVDHIPAVDNTREEKRGKVSLHHVSSSVGL